VSNKDLDFFSSAFKKNAYEIYKRLRNDRPLFSIETESGQKRWIVTCYEDAMEVLKSKAIVKSYKNVFGEGMNFSDQGKALSENMLFSDPPTHTRLRKLVTKAFTPRMISSLEGQIQSFTDTLIQNMKTQKAPIDAIKTFAFTLPLKVMSFMLGIPDTDQEKFNDWSNQIVASANDPRKVEASGESIQAFITYIKELIQDKREHPDQRLISQLIEARDEGDQLSEGELIATVFLLIVAGYETTVNLIGNGLLLLLQHPEKLAWLRNNPDRIENAVEEFLRYSGPVEMSTVRFAAEDMELSGEQIKKGDAIFISLASINRDPEIFENPDELDLERDASPHMAFGKGIHYCLGAPLARLEAKIAFRSLLEKFETISPAIPLEDMRWREGMLMRGLIECPIYVS
jgi:cytochrome P450